MELSPAQRQAAEHKDGPMLVLAGPGSGKTAVITRRTRNLIERFGVNPARILVITFTRAAAEEMKERFLALTGEESTPVSFGTFHAVYFKILKYAYHYSASNIITEEERQQALREIVSGLDLELEDEKEFLAGIAAEISLVKGERMDVEHYYSMNCADQIFRRIYQGYEERLERLGKIDFDDMLLLCYELLTKRPDILRLWQQK
ncbi:MAG TPA: UvrD-helicase domain-containing protein, partial [Candidatus Caccomorpha excrementavium]|nr:UvrD-helicase domain-containing protein [Candidatus Caccomorpha excrementavium]